MTGTRISNRHKTRLAMSGVGALAGVSMWVLVDILPDQIENERVFMGLAAFCGAFFAAWMAAAGPLSIARSLTVALAVSIVPALLLYWASFRFDEIDDFLTTGHPLLAFAVLVTIPVPFLIAQFGRTQSWRDYPELFDQAWNIVVRYAAAWIFIGVFWIVLFLSMALFDIIGLTIIEDILDIDPVPFLLTGAVLGLGLAVVNELADYVSPYLFLQLLRLLLPVVLVIVVVFLIGVPFQGLSGLFGGLSAAFILLSMAIGSVTLVSTAVDQSDEDAVSTGFMRRTSQALALVVPVLAALAGYAIWMRVSQHGWSPDRFAAATVAFFVLAYGLSYSGAVILRHHWMARIRKTNITLALALVAVAALWLTPLADPQAISAGNQLARFQAGKTPVSDLDLWTITNNWGRAGAAVLPDFKAAAGDNDELARKITLLDSADGKYQFERALDGPTPDQLAEFLATVNVRPAGAKLPDGAFADQGRPVEWLRACGIATKAGNPGCVVVVADFMPSLAGDELLLATNTNGNWINLSMWGKSASGEWQNHGLPARLDRDRFDGYAEDTLDKLYSGDFDIAPAQVNSISIGSEQLIMLP